MKKIVSMLVLGFLLTTSIVSVNAADNQNKDQYANAIIPIYVDDDNVDGPWDGTKEHPYQFIQDGVDAAEDGDKVFVFSGTYLEKVNIDKSITLRGKDRDTTIIQGMVEIKANYIKLTRFTIANIDNNVAIGISLEAGSSYNTISGNKITGIPSDFVAIGIYLDYGSHNNTIAGNIITDMTGNRGVASGIEMSSPSSYNNLLRNKITDITSTRSHARGISLMDSTDSAVIGNTITNITSTQGDAKGISLASLGWEESNNSVIIGNIITNICGHSRSVGLLVEGDHNTIEGNTVKSIQGDYDCDAMGISIRGFNGTVTGNIVSDVEGGYSSAGISLSACSYFIIKENNISNVNHMQRGYNIMLEDSTYNLITHNNLYWSTLGEGATFIFSHRIKKDDPIPWGEIPDDFDESKIESNTWYQNYWNRPRVFRKKIVGELYVGDFAGNLLYIVTLYNYDNDPLHRYINSNYDQNIQQYGEQNNN